MNTLMLRSVALVASSLLLRCGPPTPVPAADSAADTRVVQEDVAPQCLSPAVLGGFSAPCRCNTDCEGGAICQTEESFGEPMGRCIKSCATDAQCGAGFLCTRDSICTQRCNAAGQCGPGRRCFIDRCSPWCVADAECASGHCNLWSGRCAADATEPVGGRTAEACRLDADCRSNMCSDGFCVSLCVVTAPNCPDNEVCWSTSRTRLTEAGVCYKRCEMGSQCEDRRRTCQRQPGVDGYFCL